jgi:Carboxypeptidase regulatory-like domain
MIQSRVLLSLSLLYATVAHAQFATAVGIVVDSIRGRPLSGATVAVSGSEMQGVSDSAGRFRIDSIAPGEHTMAVFHPWLDAMGFSLETNKIAFGPGATIAIVLATPSAQTWIARRCSDADRQNGPGAIVGHVFQPATDDPVPGALVHYATVLVEAGKDIGVRRTTATRDASVSPAGDFIICGLPAGASGTLRATRSPASTGAITVELGNTLLTAVTLRLAPEDTLAHHAGIVTGKVTDAAGTPVSAARVTLRGTQVTTQTTDSGTFSLRDVPLGSQSIEISKAGLTADVAVVTVVASLPTEMAVKLASPPAAGDAGLVGMGFVRRRAAGGGVFITADTIAKLKARYIADLQPLLPGLMRTGEVTLVPTRSGAARCLWLLLDGVQYRAGQIRLSEHVRASDVVAIEYYEFPHVPTELTDRVFMRGFPRCSLMAIWTNAASESN